MSNLGTTVLSYILPDNHTGLMHARERLTPDHFTDSMERAFYTLIEGYGDRYGAVLPGRFLSDMMERQGFDTGKQILYKEQYSLYVNNHVTESEFLYAVDGLIDDMAVSQTGSAIATAYEILQKGVEVEGQQFQGHQAAREYLSMKNAEIEFSTVAEDAPEGDIREESAQFLSDYDRRAEEGPQGQQGIHFGIPCLDEATSGMQNGELVILAAFTNHGKASPLWTPMLTPTGWIKMGDLHVGDSVVGSDGRPTEVVGVHDRGVMDTYKVTFNDHSSVVTAADHLWQIQTQFQKDGKAAGDQFQIRSTSEIQEGLDLGRRYYIPLVQPVEFSEKDLPLDPYLLGALLGDGSFRQRTPDITNPDAQIVQRVEDSLPEGDRLGSYGPIRWGIVGTNTRRVLEDFGLQGLYSHEKFIPEVYMQGSVQQRLDLLRGLMDTDGYAGQSIDFDTTSLMLAEQVRELVQSLGGTAKMCGERYGTIDGVRHKQSYRLFIKLDLCPFYLERKAAQWEETHSRKKGKPIRRVTEVEQLHPEPVRCITVAAEDHLYVTEDYIVTHNSQMASQAAWHAAVHQGKNVFFATTETVRDQIWRRIIARHSREPQFSLPRGLNTKGLKEGSLSKEEYDVLRAVLVDLERPEVGKIHITQIPRMGNLTFVENRMIRAESQWPVDLAIVDSLYLLKPMMRRNNEREEFNDILRDAKTFATSFAKGRGVPLVSPWQMSRDSWKDAKMAGRYNMASLSDSSEAEKSPDLIVSLLRADANSQDATLQVLKSRDSETMDPRPIYLDYRNAYLGETASPMATVEDFGDSSFSLEGLLT